MQKTVSSGYVQPEVESIADLLLHKFGRRGVNSLNSCCILCNECSYYTCPVASVCREGLQVGLEK